jgi:hypothetical protein
MSLKVIKDPRSAWRGTGVPSWKCDGKPVLGGPWGVVNEQGTFLNPAPFQDKRDAVGYRIRCAQERKK